MRLICPNCDAEYEVDGDQISSEGRDVQCSNCAHTWLQMPEGFDDTVPTLTGTAELEAQPESRDEDETDAGFTPPIGAEMQPPRRTTDPDALDVIRQEVQHELQHRETEAGGIETQTELGLDQGGFAPTPPAPEIAPEITPELTPDTPSETQPPDETVTGGLAPAHKRNEGNKRELLPDIEEINSTLASAPDPVYDEDGNLDERATMGGRRGFRLGFGLMLLLTALLLLFYAYAPAQAERFPQFKTQIDAIIGFIDMMRAGLETGAQSLLKTLNGLLEGFGNN